jgi:hypothetical protein
MKRNLLILSFLLFSVSLLNGQTIKVKEPELKGISDDLNTWIKPVAGKPLLFKTVRKGIPSDFILMPYYKQFFEKGQIYWETVPD